MWCNAMGTLKSILLEKIISCYNILVVRYFLKRYPSRQLLEINLNSFEVTVTLNKLFDQTIWPVLIQHTWWESKIPWTCIHPWMFEVPFVEIGDSRELLHYQCGWSTHLLLLRILKHEEKGTRRQRNTHWRINLWYLYKTPDLQKTFLLWNLPICHCTPWDQSELRILDSSTFSSWNSQ